MKNEFIIDSDGQIEVNRRVDGNGELVDRGNAVIRIDKEPLPVERDNFDTHRLDLRLDRLVWIQRMGRPPDQHTPARCTMTHGIVHTTTSIAVECDHFGA